MKIKKIDNYKEIKQTKKSVLVLGYFDALHLGHQTLFQKAKAIARKKDLEVVVLTFLESPRLVFSKYNPELLLHVTYPEKRYLKFKEFGVDCLYLTNFTSDFAQSTADNFIATYIKHLMPDTIIVGFDYHFGNDQADAAYLQNHFQGNVITISEVKDNHHKISSTRIRHLIEEGEVSEANRLLGYEFSTRGIVVHGDARGRTIGFPTANLATIDRTHIPSDGVYVTDILVKGRIYRSMTSVGKNMTFDGQELRIEANIFDFSADVYGETVEIFWLSKIREMVKFKNVSDLIEQLHCDQKISINFRKI